jgi:hypothetical protein
MTKKGILVGLMLVAFGYIVKSISETEMPKAVIIVVK